MIRSADAFKETKTIAATKATPSTILGKAEFASIELGRLACAEARDLGVEIGVAI